MGEVASEKEVEVYMMALQKEMELQDQEQFGKQESAQSNYIVNMKNEQDFAVREANDVINETNQIEEKDKGRVIHKDIEEELDLEDEDGFDLGDDMEDEEPNQDYEEFTGHQEEGKEDDIQEDKDEKSLFIPKAEEIDTNL